MSTRAPVLALIVNGQEVSAETIRRVKACKVTQREKKADDGSLTLRDPDAELFDSQLFKKGTRLGVIMGWSDELEPRGPFIVKGQSINFPDGGETTLTVEFQDLSQKMNKKQKQKRHVNMSADAVVKQIAKAHGLGYDIESVEGPQFTDDLPLIQANLTDAALIQRLAIRFGYVWGVEGNTLYFRRPVDRESLGAQADVPVLSYRINDRSIRSFTPKVKYTKGRKRRGAKQGQSILDLLNDGLTGVLQAGRDAVSSFSPKMGEMLESLTGEEEPESSDEDADASVPESQMTQGQKREVARTEAVKAQQERKKQSAFLSFDSGESFLQTALSSVLPDDDEEDEETEPGDESGAASPQSEEEMNQRNASKVARASELVDAGLQLTVASMRWRPSSKVVVAGVGERLSGRYRVTEVAQEVTPEAAFKTTLQVQKRTFLPDNDSKAKIADAPSNAASGEGASAAAPPKTSKVEAVAQLDFASGERRIVRRAVDGKDDAG